MGGIYNRRVLEIAAESAVNDCYAGTTLIQVSGWYKGRLLPPLVFGMVHTDSDDRTDIKLAAYLLAKDVYGRVRYSGDITLESEWLPVPDLRRVPLIGWYEVVDLLADVCYLMSGPLCRVRQQVTEIHNLPTDDETGHYWTDLVSSIEIRQVLPL